MIDAERIEPVTDDVTEEGDLLNYSLATTDENGANPITVVTVPGADALLTTGAISKPNSAGEYIVADLKSVPYCFEPEKSDIDCDSEEELLNAANIDVSLTTINKDRNVITTNTKVAEIEPVYGDNTVTFAYDASFSPDRTNLLVSRFEGNTTTESREVVAYLDNVDTSNGTVTTIVGPKLQIFSVASISGGYGEDGKIYYTTYVGEGEDVSFDLYRTTVSGGEAMATRLTDTEDIEESFVDTSPDMKRVLVRDLRTGDFYYVNLDDCTPFCSLTFAGSSSTSFMSDVGQIGIISAGTLAGFTPNNSAIWGTYYEEEPYNELRLMDVMEEEPAMPTTALGLLTNVTNSSFFSSEIFAIDWAPKFKAPVTVTPETPKVLAATTVVATKPQVKAATAPVLVTTGANHQFAAVMAVVLSAGAVYMQTRSKKEKA